MSLLTYLFAGTVFFYCLGAVAALLNPKPDRARLMAFVPASIASALGMALALTVLASRQAVRFAWGSPLPGVHYSFNLDLLAAFFVLLICFIGLAGSIYSLGYVKEYIGRKNIGFMGSMYNLFLLSMLFVVNSANVFLFLVSWEVMAVASYFLVTYEHEQPGVRNAGFIYVVMTHIATVFIMLALLILYRSSGSLEFASFKGLALTPAQKDLVFMLALLGFGTKAGIVPLHIWLPRAHPAAPSNVSALMSGVMVKTAVYMLIRTAFDFTGPGPVWWGLLMLAVGLFSAFMGILYAMVDNDLKRLLAYSTVENVGIIFAGLGVSLLAMSLNLKSLAVLALGAALLHSLNHAVFKSLLFMAAGAVLQGAHSKNMEQLGGLIRRMPYTAGIFLLGSVAVSSFPPLNGFISEWLTLQALLGLGSNSTGWLRIAGPAAAAILGLVGALAAAAFVKAFGLTFLAMPRSSKAQTAKEADKTMLAGAGILAVSALLLGIIPGPMVMTLNRLSESLSGAAALNYGAWTLSGSISGLSPLLAAGLLAALTPLTLVLAGVWGGKTSVKVDETWNCGVTLTPRMQYTPTGFIKPLKLIFKTFIRQKRQVKHSFNGSRYFLHSVAYRGQVRSYFEDFLYYPLNKSVMLIARKLRGMQTGSIHLYLGYIFVTLIVLLAAAR